MHFWKGKKNIILQLYLLQLRNSNCFFVQLEGKTKSRIMQTKFLRLCGWSLATFFAVVAVSTACSYVKDSQENWLILKSSMGGKLFLYRGGSFSIVKFRSWYVRSKLWIYKVLNYIAQFFKQPNFLKFRSVFRNSW